LTPGHLGDCAGHRRRAPHRLSDGRSFQAVRHCQKAATEPITVVES
jgi:hypothetical protein